MGKVIIKTSSEGVYLVIRYTCISIVKEEEIELSTGKNILEDLPYGFYFYDDNSNISSIVFEDYDTRKITNMGSMLYGCRRLKELDLSKFDTSNVKDMGYMFSNCCGLTKLNLSRFDTSNVNNFYCMFRNCENLKELDLSNFDTSNATDMVCMFANCARLEKLDLSNFDMSNVRHMGSIFYGCDSLRHIRCKKAFRKWCMLNKNIIDLPLSMYEGGEGVWEIVD